MNRGQAVNVPVPDFTEPERELVVALLQERYGKTSELVDQEVQDFEKKYIRAD